MDTPPGVDAPPKTSAVEAPGDRLAMFAIPKCAVDTPVRVYVSVNPVGSTAAGAVY